MPTTRTSLDRPKRNLPQKRTFLVLHEPGPMAEYLAWIRRVLEHPHIDLQAILENESVLEAVDRMDAHRRDAKLKTAEFDEVWVALDLLVHPEVLALLPESKGPRLALVAPSFEHWLLSHFEDVDIDTGHDDVLERLKPRLIQYDGSLRKRENALFGRYQDAQARETRIGIGDVRFSTLIDSIRSSQQGFRGAGTSPRL